MYFSFLFGIWVKSRDFIERQEILELSTLFYWTLKVAATIKVLKKWKNSAMTNMLISTRFLLKFLTPQMLQNLR